MNILYLIGTFLLLVFSYVYFCCPEKIAPKTQQPTQVNMTEPKQAVISADHGEIFRDNVKAVLSKAFHMQDGKNTGEVIDECILGLQGIIENEPDDVPDYILAYRSVVSFLENLKEPEVYDAYMKMIDTTREVEFISEAFAWLAASMSSSRKSGFSLESIKDASKHNKIFDYIRVIVNRNVFPHLCKRQREFLLPIMDICENAITLSGVNNERGPDDGPDLFTDALHMGFGDAREFHKKMEELREFPESIADSIERSNDTVLAANIDKLTDYMKSVYSYKVIINDDLKIKPTQAMVLELVALADNVINKIKREQEKRKAAL